VQGLAARNGRNQSHFISVSEPGFSIDIVPIAGEPDIGPVTSQPGIFLEQPGPQLLAGDRRGEGQFPGGTAGDILKMGKKEDAHVS